MDPMEYMSVSLDNEIKKIFRKKNIEDKYLMF